MNLKLRSVPDFFGVEALFTSALGLKLPWEVVKVDLDTAKRRIDFEVACNEEKIMTDIKNYSLQEIGSKLIVVDEDSGNVAFRTNLGATIYFQDYHLETTRCALAKCVQNFYDLFGGELKWRSNPSTGRLVKFQKAPDPAIFLMAPGCVNGYEQIACDSKDAAPVYLIEFAGWHERYATGEKHPGELGYLHFTISINWWLENKQIFLSFLEDVCKNLPVQYGYCGLSGDVSIMGEQLQHQQVAYYIAQNYWGINFSSTHSVDYFDGHICSVDWINIFSEKTVNLLGGFDLLSRKLEDEGISYKILDREIYIFSSNEPQIGFRSAPSDYAKLAAILKPARVEKYFLPYAFNYERATSWLYRFDSSLSLGVPKWPGDILAPNTIRLRKIDGNSWLNVVTS